MTLKFSDYLFRAIFCLRILTFAKIAKFNTIYVPQFAFCRHYAKKIPVKPRCKVYFMPLSLSFANNKLFQFQFSDS